MRARQSARMREMAAAWWGLGVDDTLAPKLHRAICLYRASAGRRQLPLAVGPATTASCVAAPLCRPRITEILTTY